MNTKETLQAAYTLLDDKRKWTKGVMARTAVGEPVDPLDFDANCWCAMGALVRVAQSFSESDDALCLLKTACREMYQERRVGEVNDHLGYRQIRAASRRAIKNA